MLTKEISEFMSYNEIINALEAHDDRVKEGNSEIRMLTSMDSKDVGGFVFYVVLKNGQFYGSYHEDQEEQAIRSYMEGR